MKSLKHSIVNITSAAILSGAVIGTAIAEDIEIYVGNADTSLEVRPNIIFIVDTSGSMRSNVVSQGGYDPTVDYSGGSGCFDPDRIYYSTGTLPSWCGTNNWFNRSALKCDAGQAPLYNTVPPVAVNDPAIASGWYQDRIAQWRNRSGTNRDSWIAINRNAKDAFIECKTDQGVHGENSGDADKWVANRANGPWSNDSNDALDWNNIGRGYTLYTGNYLNWTKTAPGVISTRLDVVKEVTYDVVDSSNNVNIGLMRFDTGAQGGMVTYQVFDVAGARGDFKSRLQTYSASGGTPLSEVLYEAQQYWAGKDVVYGLTSNPSHSIGDARKNGADNGEYLSPIEYTCQKNFNILLSDGEATGDGSADTAIEALPGFMANIGGCVNNCLDELAEYMHTQDIYDGLDGTQTAATYTVGFAIDHDLLRSTATRGGAKYYRADDAVELTEAFNKIIAEILSINTTFSSPAVSINAFNRTTHREDLYFTLFKPAVGPRWNGNLKRFKLSFVAGAPVITDVQNNPAVNETTGFFSDQAYSWWSNLADLPDGGEVEKGGAAGQIATRTVYTYTGSGTPVNVDLTSPANEFHENNTALTKALLGISSESDQYRTDLIQWARGLDYYDLDGDGVYTDPRQVMGDPLHAEPGLAQYGGTDADPDITAYVATNDGVLHAIDTRDGTEIFSFIPRELLPLQPVVFEDALGTGKAYGLDGSVDVWIKDENKNGIIESPNDHVYIYFGMRRGGRNYYAMDVTDRSSPKLMWMIEGGAGDYAELGESWSNIQRKKLKVNGVDRHVVMFAGGYDTNQDAVSTRTTDTVGRAIFIADALTGQRLWWAGPPGSGADIEFANMQYSIPAKLRAVSVRGTSYVDRIYVGDMGGQIWRFDIAQGEGAGTPLNTLVSGYRMVDIAGATTAENRRFYYPPDVALISESSGDPYLGLAVSSGYRAHPLDKNVHDRIYLIRDPYIYNPAPTGTYLTTPITEADLFDTTNNAIGENADNSTEVTALQNSDGWFIELKEPSGSYIGEKGLSEILIIEGQVVATTYVPQDLSTSEACKPADGQGFVYFMNVSDATPTYNFDTTVDDMTAADRKYQLTRGGIPPNPVPLYTKDGSAIIVGTEDTNNPIDNRPLKLFWYEQ